MTNIEMGIRIVEKEKSVKCVLKADGREFVFSRKIENQADRVSAVKRAKQLAYLGCMSQFNGHICDKINHI